MLKWQRYEICAWADVPRTISTAGLWEDASKKLGCSVEKEDLSHRHEKRLRRSSGLENRKRNVDVVMSRKSKPMENLVVLYLRPTVL